MRSNQKPSLFEAVRKTDDSENEYRVFLRGEVARHNLLLANSARTAGIIEPIDYAIFQNHGYMGLYGGPRADEIKRIRKKY